MISRPLFDAGRRFAGVIVVAVPPPALEQVFGDIPLVANGLIVLKRADGAVLARSGNAAAGELLVSERGLQNYPLTLVVSQSMDVVLAPYRQVTDHRTELKIGDVHGVMDGDLDAFIEAYLKKFGGGAAA